MDRWAVANLVGTNYVGMRSSFNCRVLMNNVLSSINPNKAIGEVEVSVDLKRCANVLSRMIKIGVKICPACMLHVLRITFIS